MTYGITWQEETEARLKEARQKENEFCKVSKRAEAESMKWKEIGDALEKVLSLYRERNLNVHQVVDYESLKQKSTWENLKDMMLANKGLLSVVDAVTVLVKAGAFNDRELARNAIYSTLFHHKRDVKRLRKGVYKFVEHEKNTPKKHHVHRKISGISEAVRQIKSQNNNLTKQEVLNKLIEDGFDFQGKDPEKSVHMAWARLGYYPSKGKQQLLSPEFKESKK